MPMQIKSLVLNAGGENKAEAIAAAMKGGYINALVTDQDTAAAILRS